MKLFEVDEHFEVQLDKPWIMLIPEFAAVLARDKGSEGDYRGSKKLRARKELSYVYFICDFHSPIRDYDDDKKKEEALRYARLTPKDIDAVVLTAQKQYEAMQYENAPSLRTLNSLKKGMGNLDKYFEEVDFDKVDKLGKVKYTPDAYIANITKLPKMRASIKEFERMVEEELRENTGIRGKAKLGGQEGKRRDKPWVEGADPDAIEQTETVEL